MLIFYVIVMAVCVALLVLQYVVLYRLFMSCKPNSAAVFLILSIFCNVTLPYLIFACRNDDAPYIPPQQPQGGYYVPLQQPQGGYYVPPQNVHMPEPPQKRDE